MDARLDNIMIDICRNDNSFKEEETIFNRHKYTQKEVRKIWFEGIRHGIEQGLFISSLEGQKIEITRNICDKRQEEFYNKFLELANTYKCQIQYHPIEGMCIIDLIKKQW